jgi:hypothetical protein
MALFRSRFQHVENPLLCPFRSKRQAFCGEVQGLLAVSYIISIT